MTALAYYVSVLVMIFRSYIVHVAAYSSAVVIFLNFPQFEMSKNLMNCGHILVKNLFMRSSGTGVIKLRTAVSNSVT